MITSISLQRFRGFHQGGIELKPLTVLLGPNSAGKSSFLQAVAALHFLRRLGISPATLAPRIKNPSSWPLDLGTRQTLQTKGTEDAGGVRITLGLHVNNARASMSYEFGRPTEDSLDISRVKIGALRPEVETTSATAGTSISVPMPTAVIGTDGKEQTITDDVEVVRVGANFWQVPNAEAVVPTLEKLELKHFSRHSGTLTNLVSEAQKDLLHSLDLVRYLRPSRANPERENPLRPKDEPADYVGPAGEWTGATWLAMAGTSTQFIDPPPPRLDRKNIRPLLDAPSGETRTAEFQTVVNRWMVHIGVATAVAAELRDKAISVRANIHGDERSLADVGFGLSQLVPTIVQGVALPLDGTLVVEHPEAQLHPYAQAGLADFLCSLVQQGRRCIVETHSEALFRRLHLRALLDPDLGRQIAAYFINPSTADGCTDPVFVPLELNRAIEWPRDFLSESSQAHAAFAAVHAELARSRKK